MRDYIIGGTIGAISISLLLWPEIPDPIKLISARIVETCTIDDQIVEQCTSSDRMRIAYEVHWSERCPVFFEIFVFKDSVNQDVVWRNGPIRAAFEDGHQKWVRDVFVPPHLINGEYYYRARMVGRCRAKEWPVAVPDMHFRIERGGKLDG